MADSTQRRPKLGDLLLAAGAISQTQLEIALAEQKQWGRPFGMTLLQLGMIDERTMIRALAGQLGVPIVKLRGKAVNPDVLALVSIDVAEKHRCLPLLIRQEGESPTLYVCMEDPGNSITLDELTERVGMAIQPVLAMPSELDEAIHRHYHWEGFGGERLGATLGSSSDPFGTNPTQPDLANPAEEALDPDSAPDREALPLQAGLALAEEAGFELDSDAEPEFVGLEGEAIEPPTRTEGTAVTGPDTAPGSRMADVSSDTMLRAIAQLLVEKGVFTRDELVARLRSVAGEGS